MQVQVQVQVAREQRAETPSLSGKLCICTVFARWARSVVRQGRPALLDEGATWVAVGPVDDHQTGGAAISPRPC